MDAEPVLLGATLKASALAGVASRCLLHPIDTYKVLVQTTPLSSVSSSNMGAVSILKRSGLKGLYRGFLPALYGTVPGVCLYFGSFNYANRALTSITSANPILANFAAGFIAEAVSCVVWVPTDVVKERAQASLFISRAPSVNQGSSVIREIVTQEGLRGLYRGYGATLAAFGPFSAFYFMFVEQLKQSISRVREKPVLSFPELISACALAGGGAALITAPLDLVKVRMQVERRGVGSSDAAKYSTVWKGLCRIVSEEGLRGLFRGGGSRVWFAVPNTAITMSLMETFQRRF